MKRNLLLGCGNDRRKKVALSNETEWSGDLVTMDMNPDCHPDIHGDIHRFPPRLGIQTLPFADEEFDYIGAYDVLEHWGSQGDWRRGR